RTPEAPREDAAGSGSTGTEGDALIFAEQTLGTTNTLDTRPRSTGDVHQPAPSPHPSLPAPSSPLPATSSRHQPPAPASHTPRYPPQHRAGPGRSPNPGQGQSYQAPAHRSSHVLHSIPPRQTSTYSLIVDYLGWLGTEDRLIAAENGVASRESG